ncbi:hypothetical protein L873DRAFT_117740 [Choiromyces venosus 120613-1]|uniref:Uncharacterized protein n=1 Tax=Choiromyces venosus 120613-1 TaxID=1336337 RepID=A0A3N4J3S7_9PEZI|nr:hypothetical protein L873DRAFT_117740 [Choiromyces venosus 120613-1]
MINLCRTAAFAKFSYPCSVTATTFPKGFITCYTTHDLGFLPIIYCHTKFELASCLVKILQIFYGYSCDLQQGTQFLHHREAKGHSQCLPNPGLSMRVLLLHQGLLYKSHVLGLKSSLKGRRGRLMGII